jgi:glycosyltransferase involved in cell wall biosynthesis
MQALIDRLIASEDYDLIQVETSQMASFQFSAGPLLVLTEHDIGYELLERLSRIERNPIRAIYNRIEYRKFREEELRAWDKVDACVVMSEREKQIVHQHRPDKLVKVIPNGVDVDYFNVSHKPSAPDTIVFTGLMCTRPNVDAVVYFVQEILPHIHRIRPNATFTIVGAMPTSRVKQLAGPHVKVIGAVPDVRSYVHEAAVMVVPLRAGSGTRLKILEGSAMGKAIVSTSVGCEGINARDRTHLLIADGPKEFAQQVLRVLGDQELANMLGRSARALAENEYSWNLIAGESEKWYVELARMRRS